MNTQTLLLTLGVLAACSCGAPSDVEDVGVDDEPAAPLEFSCGDDGAPLSEEVGRCIAGDDFVDALQFDPCRECWEERAPIGCVDGDGYSLDNVLIVRREDGALFKVGQGSRARELAQEQPEKWLITSNLIAPTSDRPCQPRIP